MPGRRGQIVGVNNRCPWPWRRTPPRTVSARVLMSVKERVKWSAVAPSPRAACFAARSAFSLPGTPTWEGTHCRTIPVPRVTSLGHRPALRPAPSPLTAPNPARSHSGVQRSGSGAGGQGVSGDRGSVDSCAL